MLCGNMVYLPLSLVEAMSSAFSQIERTGNRLEDIEAYRPLAQMYAKSEMSDLEVANYHKDYPNPITALKIRTFEGYHSS